MHWDQFHVRRGTSLATIAALLLVLVDVARLRLLPQPYEATFMVIFEIVVCLLCTAACTLAAARSAPGGKGRWLLTALFFLLLAVSDSHDFLQLLPSAGPVYRSIEFLAWTAYAAFALLIFFPEDKEGKPDWGWLGSVLKVCW